MWFRSGREVVRFGADGSIATFTTPKPSVFLVHEARDGSVWIAFRDQYRLVRYDHGIFSDVPLPPIKSPKLTGEYAEFAVTMAEDPDGELLLLTPAGLVRIVDGRLSPPEAASLACEWPRIAQGTQPPGGSRRQSLGWNRSGWGWFVSGRAPLDSRMERTKASQTQASMPCFRIAKAASGWAETFSIGSTGIGFIVSRRDEHRAIAQTRDGDLWFGGYAGLYRWRLGVLSHFKVEAPAVKAIYQDREGTLWIGASLEDRPGGLFRFRDEKLEQIPGHLRRIPDYRGSGRQLLGGRDRRAVPYAWRQNCPLRPEARSARPHPGYPPGFDRDSLGCDLRRRIGSFA